MIIMKKRNIIYIVIAAVIIIGVIVFFVMKKAQKSSYNSSFLYIGKYSDNEFILEKGYVFRDYDDFKTKLNSNKLKEKDFENNNYVLIPISYDECAEKDVTPAKYTIRDNNIDVLVEYEANCGGCASINEYYLIKVDKKVVFSSVDIKYKATNEIHCDQGVDYKPIIYLYPQKETTITVKLGYPELLLTSYPKYNNEWKVLAKPNGDLVDESGSTYYGLYWEGKTNIKDNFTDGFVVSREETIAFLEEKLSILGLNEREANEFIIYWLPKLEENEYNFIRFESLDKINEQMPLNITPTPDTLIRVLMEYKSVNSKMEVQEQELKTPSRKGFTVVEWGGTKLK